MLDSTGVCEIDTRLNMTCVFRQGEGDGVAQTLA